MSEEILATNALLAELARRSTRIDGLLDDVAQMRREIAAERRAREMAEMRLYAYGDHQPQCPHLRGACSCGFATINQTTPHLLAELAAARAVVEVARAWIDWPGMNAAIADYDQAKKARGE